MTVYLRRSSSQPLAELAQEIIELFNEKLGADLVESSVKALGEAEAALLVFEKFYLRASNYVNLALEITSYGGVQEAVAVGSAGGDGLLNISWGANKNFAKTAAKILAEIGFEEITQ